MQSGLVSLSDLIFKLSPHMFLPEPEYFWLKKKKKKNVEKCVLEL